MPSIQHEDGAAAVAQWARCQAETCPRPVVATAVRYTLQQLAAAHPGRAVEVRVPPFGAVQILSGTTHRRGTPPAVVETDSHTWLALATGRLSWGQALATGRVSASGQRTDLASLLPLSFPAVQGAKNRDLAADTAAAPPAQLVPDLPGVV